MPCYYPLDGYRSKAPNENGNFYVVFDPKFGQKDAPMSVACGRCIGCRLERSRQWAIRCVHEAQLHDANSFITLTYDEESIPFDHSLNKKHFQDFMKRLRKRLQPKKIRYYMCGEYGTEQDPLSPNKLGRPHYHAIIFGHDFPDKEAISTGKHGDVLYTSPLLAKAWPFGNHWIGEMTFESAAYVARYCTKKITGDQAEEHYRRIDPATGEQFELQPEYGGQSTHPGIAAGWFKKFRKDMDKGFITTNGIKMPAPDYYHKLYARDHYEDYEPIKTKKLQSIDPDDPEYSIKRLRVKEALKLKKINELKRNQQ